MENEFLTKRCRVNPLVLVLSVGVFGLAILFYIFIYFALFEDRDIAAALAVLLAAVILTLPLAACIIRLVRGHMAKTLAQKLCSFKGIMIDAAEFELLYGVKDAAKNIELLCVKGYLTKVAYDRSSGKIYFGDRIDPMSRFRRLYACPSCGAEGELEPYAPSVCEYCGSDIESYVKV